MERRDRGNGSRLLDNQPYDESLEVDESEDCSPSPQSQTQSGSRRSRKGRGLMSTNSEELDEEPKPQRGAELPGGRSPEEEEDEEEDEEEEEEEEEDSDEDDSDDDEEPGDAPEGMYDPADYANLPVSTEIKELFQYITRYSPQTIELDHSLKPFIPDFIPAVGDIDAFLKVPRPDGTRDDLGLLVLDEPSVKQSDPTVMTLWLSEESKQHGATELKVTSVASPQSNPRPVELWVESIAALHRSKPAASVQYGRVMPDVDVLMEEWPSELEELLGILGRRAPPSAAIDCSLSDYVDAVCAVLDVPVYSSRVQSLHLVFNLYLAFRDSLHFNHRA